MFNHKVKVGQIWKCSQTDRTIKISHIKSGIIYAENILSSGCSDNFPQFFGYKSEGGFITGGNCYDLVSEDIDQGLINQE